MSSLQTRKQQGKYVDFRPPQFKSVKPGANIQCAYEWLNDRHFVVTISGKTWVANIDGEDLTFSSFEDFKKRYCNWKVDNPVLGANGSVFVPVQPAGMWLEAKDRREHSSIVLDPGPELGRAPYAYNLWDGFGVNPASGSWDTIAWHLLYVVCGGNEQHYQWLLHWMAYCVQHPERQAETAVVLRGRKGTGKGLAAKIMLRIFGRHTFHVSSQEHFLGRFNGHLMKILFLFVDEGFWSGDKRNEGRLKALITEDQLAFEGKYQPTVMMPNRLKVMMASNEGWVVPATADERRFFVLDVSDRCKGDRGYFTRLAAAIDGDELSSFLHHLLALGLSQFDHRNPPHTESLNEQKLKSLTGFDRFWFNTLWEGILPGDAGWSSSMSVKALYDAYKEDAGLHPQNKADVGKRLGDLVPGLRKVRPRGQDGRFSSYRLPALAECRAGFLKALRIDDYDWDGQDRTKPEHKIVGKKPEGAVIAGTASVTGPTTGKCRKIRVRS